MRQWLVIAAIVAGGILVISSLTLIAVILGIVLLPAAIWMWLTGKLKSSQDSVIEGKARRVDEGAVVLPSLSETEKATLENTPVWIVRYRDEFTHDENPHSYERYAYGVAVCFSEADAEAEARRRGEPFKPGWAGYDFYGPVSPLSEFRDDGHPDNVLRIILARLAAQSREPISIRD